MKPYTHFTLEERESLYLLLTLNKKISEIAKELGRSKSTISREIKRNSNKSTGKYNSWGANSLYHRRRKKCRRKPRIDKGSELYEYICEKLGQYWSPQIIAAKWNLEHPDDTVAFTTIYVAVKRNFFDGITSKTHLRRRGKRRYARRSRFNTIHPEHTVHELPEEARNRLRFGDFEGDTLKGAIGKGCLVTYVDRKSRRLLAAISKDMSSRSVYEATLKAFGDERPKSIILDNGSEFALFKEMERELHTTIYFADPHSPWQRPLNENTNDILRFFFPKGFDFTKLSEHSLNEIVDLINSRPRLCLALHSPDSFCCT